MRVREGSFLGLQVWAPAWACSLSLVSVVAPCRAEKAVLASVEWLNRGSIPQNGAVVLRASALPSVKVQSDDGVRLTGALQTNPRWPVGVYAWYPSQPFPAGQLRLEVAFCDSCPALLDTPVTIVPAVEPLALTPVVKIELGLQAVSVGPKRCCNGAGLVADRCFAGLEQIRPVLFGLSASFPNADPVMTGQLWISWSSLDIPRADSGEAAFNFSPIQLGTQPLRETAPAPIQLQEGPWSVCANVQVQSLASLEVRKYSHCSEVPASPGQAPNERDLSHELAVDLCPLPPDEHREQYCQLNAAACHSSSPDSAPGCEFYSALCPLAERRDLRLGGGCSLAGSSSPSNRGGRGLWVLGGVIAAALRTLRRRGRDLTRSATCAR